METSFIQVSDLFSPDKHHRPGPRRTRAGRPNPFQSETP